MCNSPRLIYVNKMLKSDKDFKNGSLIMDKTLDNIEYCKSLVEQFGGDYYSLKCGKCNACRLQRKQEWSIRCWCELQTTKKHSYFITLTYNDDNLSDISLNKKDFQLFLKRLRKKFGNGIKYLLSGEYGETTGRKHAHLILFNIELDDLEELPLHENYYTSKNIVDLWSKGNVLIGYADFDNIRYTTGYVTKKIAEKEYKNNKLLPPFIMVSKGISDEYFNLNYKKLYENDFIAINGKQFNLPRYFDKLYSLINLKHLREVRSKRDEKSDILFNVDNKTDTQLNYERKSKELYLQHLLDIKNRNQI